MTLDEIWMIANYFLPKIAVDPSRIGNAAQAASWGPAHEIAHALVASPEERTRPFFGLPCSPEFCRCDDERCHVVELAAMDVSRRILVSAGRRDLVDAELKATTDYDLMAHAANKRAARRLIARSRLRRIPRDADRLVAMLHARAS